MTAPQAVGREGGLAGWVVELVLPRTDAGVAVQAVVLVAVLLFALPMARRWRVAPLWVGTALTAAGLFAVRAIH